MKDHSYEWPGTTTVIPDHADVEQYPVSNTLWEWIYLKRYPGSCPHISGRFRKDYEAQLGRDVVTCIRANGSPRFTECVGYIIEFDRESGNVAIHEPVRSVNMAVPVSFPAEYSDDRPIGVPKSASSSRPIGRCSIPDDDDECDGDCAEALRSGSCPH